MRKSLKQRIAEKKHLIALSNNKDFWYQPYTDYQARKLVNLYDDDFEIDFTKWIVKDLNTYIFDRTD